MKLFSKIMVTIMMIVLVLTIAGCNKDCPVENCTETTCPDCLDNLESIEIGAGVQMATYKCVSRNIESECIGFTKYVHPQGKCLNPDGNKICKTGWELVEEAVPVIKPVIKSSGKTYTCKRVSQGGCPK